ncbi:MAG TPA: adenylate/guanylate cyclase domain-containing protein [Pseudolabrys sp.]|nr:adenylate/guanylate cyclase domain-containing protein [Pseudolabrys sp.]
MAAEIDEWLARIGLAKYAPVFAENEIDIEVLPDLTEEDLKDLNIPLGSRKKLMKAIAAMIESPPAAADDERKQASAIPIRTHAEAERRQLTVMFCDLVGSTSLSTRFDPEDLREIVRAYQDACAKVVSQYNGFIAKYLGDGVLVYFGYPQAHENDAERAVRAGLGIVREIPSIKATSENFAGLQLSVRVGISTGLVVVGDVIGEEAAEQASAIGETPNVAARLQALAQSNEVVIGPLTRELIGEKFLCEGLGDKQLRGLDEPLAVWRVIAESETDSGVELAAARTANLPLVGRPEELGLLLRSWDSSRKSRGQVVLIQGEPGIGKSRLVEALRAKLTEGDHLWMVTRCSPYHTNTSLYPIVERLKHAAGWSAEDGDAHKLSKLETALSAQSLPLERAVPLYADLMRLPLPEGSYVPLRLTPQEQREQTLDALVGWLLDEAERRPVLHVWEDLHWADPTTIELLKLCIEQSPTVPMMSVLTYRSDFAVPWTMRSHMTLITLNRLDRGEVEKLMLQRTAGKAIPSEVIDYVARKTDGIPLYVEELTKAILEANFLREDGDSYALARPLSGIAIPSSLQDLLMARLDRLPSIREVAQLGSILGREFAYEMLQAIASLDQADLEKGLDQLVDAELLYQRGRRPRARYTFKHALVQDAAYQSLLKRTRQFYHRQVAILLEERHPELCRNQPEILAHHFSRAEEHGRALRYLTAMAEKSTAMSAHTEAVASLQEARRHADELPSEVRDREVLKLVVREAHSLHFLGRRKEIIALLTQYSGRLARLEDRSLTAEYFFWFGFAHAWLGNRGEAIEYLQQSLVQAKAADDLAIAGRVHRALATEYVYSGKPLAEAVDHAREAAALLERTDDRFWLSQALFTLSYCCIFAGDFASALEAASKLTEFADATGIRRAQANAAMLAGLSHAMQGDAAQAVELCQRALDVSPDEFETAFILACLGRSRLAAGSVELAIDSLEQAVSLGDKVRSIQFRAWFRTILGEAYIVSGEFEKAAVVLGEAHETSITTQFVLGIGLARQLLGRLARLKGDLAEAEQNLNEALAHLTSTGAVFETARTSLELAELARARGDQSRAAEELARAQVLFARLKLPVQGASAA